MYVSSHWLWNIPHPCKPRIIINHVFVVIICILSPLFSNHYLRRINYQVLRESRDRHLEPLHVHQIPEATSPVNGRSLRARYLLHVFYCLRFAIACLWRFHNNRSCESVTTEVIGDFLPVFTWRLILVWWVINVINNIGSIHVYVSRIDNDLLIMDIAKLIRLILEFINRTTDGKIIHYYLLKTLRIII